MTALVLRPIGSNDYYVIDAGEPVGRIRLASERRGEVWMWSVGVLIPAPPYGTSDSLESAKVAFKDAWLKFKAEVGPEQLADAFETAQAARDRLKKQAARDRLKKQAARQWRPPMRDALVRLLRLHSPVVLPVLPRDSTRQLKAIAQRWNGLPAATAFAEIIEAQPQRGVYADHDAALSAPARVS